jgi:hypothetical protein
MNDNYALAFTDDRMIANQNDFLILVWQHYQQEERFFLLFRSAVISHTGVVRDEGCLRPACRRAMHAAIRSVLSQAVR